MDPIARQTIAGGIERLEALDAVAGPLQQGVRASIPPGPLKDLLSGTWLGHPLHPPLTDIVVGAWTSALLLDVLGGGGAEDAADALVAAGILAAVPTAASGLSDWADLSGGRRRVGTVHALGNTSALLLHVCSYAARRRGDRRVGLALSTLGYGAATFSAWLGGHLSFGKGVGVNQTAFEELPTEWTPVLETAALEDEALTPVQAGTVGVLLVRTHGRDYALADRCSHRGCALHEGRLNGDGTVTCPCHGSTFRLEDGSIAKGPATSPQPALDVRRHERMVQVRRAESASAAG